MGVLTDLASAIVKQNVKTLYGTVLTRPALLVSDGINAIYACDVDIGQNDPTGRINQWNQQKKNGEVKTDGDGNTIPNDIEGLPGQQGWTLDKTLTVNNILHNVVIARDNADLIYADIGCPVKLERSQSGQWQITGFSIEQPGTYTLIPVDLEDFTIGPVGDFSLSTRLLTFGELGTLAPFGQLPFGASGIFVGGELLKVA